jgi:hypothetical protein
LGVQWLRPNDFSIKLDWAIRLGDEKTAAETRKSRVWLQGAKYF